MGCNESKEEPRGSTYSIKDPIPQTGMGNVGRGMAELISPNAPPRVSVMNGRWEIDRSKLDQHHVESIGEGAFGLVYEGRIVDADLEGKEHLEEYDPEGMLIIVKKLKRSANAVERSEFLKEIQVMKEIDHPNILRLVGVVTQDSPLLMAFEACSGGILKNYLYARRSGNLSPKAIANMAANAASGLVYLVEHKVIHKDLATRNCLITGRGTVKIGDYGLSYQKFAADYFALDAKGPKLPVRWMAPETLQDIKTFSHASDVWSFGILMWEIAALGNNPYPALSNSEVANHVIEGGKIVSPKHAPDGFEPIMRQCLVPAAERPTAVALRDSLVAFAEQIPGEVPVAEAPPAAASKQSSKSSLGAGSTPASPTSPASPASPMSPSSMGASPDIDDTYSAPQDAASALAAMNESPEKVGRRQSYRSLTLYKEAENPEEEFRRHTVDSSVPLIDRKDVTLEGDLGKGAFGVVRQGTLQHDGTSIKIALKTLKEGATDNDRDALLAEARLVSQFKHPNVVACFGQVLDDVDLMIVFELMEKGSLFDYLQENDPALQRKIKMAIDIATGMAYLEANNHDLATRNILVNESLTCKVSDFGLSRDLADDTYYESEGGLVPIRWTAPEAYKFSKYSSASDVWSFGITLYEVWTQAALPYTKDWTNMNVMMEVERGYRLPPPPNCPKAIYSLMIDCWNPARRSRPTFAMLRDRLQMAHDMLFSADDGSELEVKLDTEYGDMDKVYMGVPVPTLDELDSAYLEPTPVNSAQSSSISLIRGRTSGSDLGTPLTAEEKQQTLWEQPKLKLDATEANPRSTSTDATAREHGTSVRRNSLRKQKYDEEKGAGVEYVSHRRVADVLALSKQREQISQMETTGIKNYEKLSGTQADYKSEYIESVGRALDVQPQKVAGREKCVCRRFKCVCGFK